MPEQGERVRPIWRGYFIISAVMIACTLIVRVLGMSELNQVDGGWLSAILSLGADDTAAIRVLSVRETLEELFLFQLLFSGLYLFGPPLVLGLSGWAVSRHARPVSAGWRRVSFAASFCFLVALLILLAGIVVDCLDTRTDFSGGWVLYPPPSEGPMSVVWQRRALSGAMCAAGLISCLGFALSASGILSLARLSVSAVMSFVVLVIFFLVQIAMLWSIALLLSDRHFGATFFDLQAGGDPVLFQHLYWLLGQPELYGAIFTNLYYSAALIGLGYIVSRRFGVAGLLTYASSVVVLLIILAIGFVDLQGSYAAGMGGTTQSIPSAIFKAVFHPITQACVLLFCAALLIGRFSETSLLKRRDVTIAYILSTIIFLVGMIIAGLMISRAGVDKSLHDTYYVVAHWQYVVSLVLGFLVFAVLLQLLPKRYPAFLGWAQFACFTVGVFCITLPQFFLPLQGMPRRYVDYENTRATWSGVANVGAVLIAISLLLMIVIVTLSLMRRLKQKTDQE